MRNAAGPTQEDLEKRVKMEAAIRREEREEAKKAKAKAESQARFASRFAAFSDN